MKKWIFTVGTVLILLIFAIVVLINQNSVIESNFVIAEDYQTVEITIFDDVSYNGTYTIDTAGKLQDKNVGKKAESLLKDTSNIAFVYNKDGELIDIETEVKKIEKFREKSYLIGPKVDMYSSKQEKKEVGFSDIEKARQEGWYYGKPTTLYAEDGRELIIGENDISVYQALGWSKEKFVTVYAPDGRSKNISAGEVADYKSVGWFETKEEADAEKKRQEQETASKQAQQAKNNRTTVCPVNGYTSITRVAKSSSGEVYMCPAHGSHVYMTAIGGFLE